MSRIGCLYCRAILRREKNCLVKKSPSSTNNCKVENNPLRHDSPVDFDHEKIHTIHFFYNHCNRDCHHMEIRRERKNKKLKVCKEIFSVAVNI